MSKQLAETLNGIVNDLSARLLDLDPAAAAMKPAPDSWSPKEILGHLIDSAVNNHHRFVRAQDEETFHFPRYAQGAWVARQHYNDREWRSLVDLWRAYNLHLAHVIAHIPSERLDTPCVIGDDPAVTLKFLIEDYLSHMTHHLTQITPARQT